MPSVHPSNFGMNLNFVNRFVGIARHIRGYVGVGFDHQPDSQWPRTIGKYSSDVDR